MRSYIFRPGAHSRTQRQSSHRNSRLIFRSISRHGRAPDTSLLQPAVWLRLSVRVLYMQHIGTAEGLLLGGNRHPWRNGVRLCRPASIPLVERRLVVRRQRCTRQPPLRRCHCATVED